MAHMVLLVLILLVAALTAFLAVRLLLNLRWVIGFVRGSVGLLLLAVAAMLALAAVDFDSYHEIRPDLVVANVSFVKTDAQLYRVTVVDASGNERQADVHGDLWQPGVRLFEWSGVLKSAGLKPVYRFDRIRGRYYALEQERKAVRDEPLMFESRYGADLWHLGYHNNILLPGVTTSYRDSTFQPMADGALFEIHLTESGVFAKPLNEPAQHAVSEWR